MDSHSAPSSKSDICEACGQRFAQNVVGTVRHAAWHLPREAVTGEMTRMLWRTDPSFRPAMVAGMVTFIVLVVVAAVAGALVARGGA